MTSHLKMYETYFVESDGTQGKYIFKYVFLTRNRWAKVDKVKQ